MTCAEFRDRVEELLDGLLPPEEAGRFEAHAAECRDCAERMADADRFSALLGGDGQEAIGQWVAQRLALRAATDAAAEAAAESLTEPATAAVPAAPRVPVSRVPPVDVGADTKPIPIMEIGDTQEIPGGELLPRTPLRLPRRSRFQVARLAAAAVLVAAIGFFSAGLVGDSDVLALSAGVETRIESGQLASAGAGRTISAEDRAVMVTLVPDSDDGQIEMSRGVALFHVAPGRPLAVITDGGTARGVGASFIVDVRGDGAVAVGGVTGRVRFERNGERTTLRTGERIEVDRHGRVRLVSGAQIDRLEVERALWESEFQNLRDRLDDAEEQLVAYGAAAAQDGIGADATDALPVDELGRAMRVLLDRSVGFKDSRRSKAMGVFLVNAERIQSEFGASDPMRAMQDPRFMLAISESFVRALAPDASDMAVAGATTEWHRATDDLLIVMDSEPMPAQLAVAREKAFLRVIRALERHLGVGPAAEVVRGAAMWGELRPHANALDERVESRYVAYWQKRFGMDEVQMSELSIIVRNYIAETIRAQGQIAATLPPNEIEDALYPRWRRRGWGSRSKGKENDASAAPAEEPSDSEIFTSGLRRKEARIALAEPRIRFERALWNLLRSDQREKGFGWGARVNSFREPVEK